MPSRDHVRNIDSDHEQLYRDIYTYMQDSEITPASTFDERRPDLAPYALTCQRLWPSLMPRPDRHNELELNLLRSGRLTYLLRGRRVTVEPGRLTA